jgi:hypothetical protein
MECPQVMGFPGLELMKLASSFCSKCAHFCELVADVAVGQVAVDDSVQPLSEFPGVIIAEHLVGQGPDQHCHEAAVWPRLPCSRGSVPSCGVVQNVGKVTVVPGIPNSMQSMILQNVLVVQDPDRLPIEFFVCGGYETGYDGYDAG